MTSDIMMQMKSQYPPGRTAGGCRPSWAYEIRFAVAPGGPLLEALRVGEVPLQPEAVVLKDQVDAVVAVFLQADPLLQRLARAQLF